MERKMTTITIRLRMVSAGFMLLLHAYPVFSCAVQMKNLHLSPWAPSSVIKAVPDEAVLPVGSNVTISCMSNLSKVDYGSHHNAQPYWIQIYQNDNFSPTHECGGGDLDREDSKVCTFVIQNATTKDTGTYECWSYNAMCYTIDSMNVDFREPSPLSFTLNPPRLTYVSAESNVNMSCEASGFPFPVLTWYKDGLPVAGEKTLGVKGVSQLTIETVTSAKQGIYWCEARNSHGLKRSFSTTLILKQKPTISLYRQSVSVYLEGNYTVVSFLCKATGIPRPLIGWLKDNSTKTNGTVIQTGAISMLILLLVGKDNKRGKYSCFAKNSAGEAFTMARGVSGEILFYGHPRSTNAFLGDHVVFTCAAEGSPVPKITWLKDGMPNVNGNAKSVQGKGSAFSVLTIYSVEDRHGGKYACQANSPMGNIISREALLSITALNQSQDDASSSSSDSELLWVSVASAAILLVVVVVLIFVIHSKYKKAGFKINKEINEGQKFSHYRIHEDAMIKQPSNKNTSTAPHLQVTNMTVENEAYMMQI